MCRVKAGFRIARRSIKSALVIFLVGAVSSLLGGCDTMFGKDGWFPDSSSDYLNAEQSDSLTLPDGTQAAASEDYPIPELQYANVLPEKYEVPRASSKADLENKGSVRIQRFDDSQWILIQRSPSEAWPLVLYFLTSNNIAISRQSAEQGVIETERLTLKSSERQQLFAKFDDVASDLPDERYRIVLARGVQKRTTEISVVQRSVDQSTEENDGLSRSNSQVREDNMVNLLAEYLAGSPEQSSHSLLAQGLGSASKARLSYDDNGVPFIALELGFDRGWASLGLALKKSGFDVSDIDRSKGIYFTMFTPPNHREKKVGYLRRAYRALFSRNKKNEQGDAIVVSLKRDETDYVKIAIQREDTPLLESNEQAFMLRRILDKLT